MTIIQQRLRLITLMLLSLLFGGLAWQCFWRATQ